MVTIINFKERQTEEGKVFFVLEAQGGIEMIQSKVTGNFYATAKKAFIPATFDEVTCKALIGTQMQGQIIKEECDPYEYINKESGEVIMMSHRYVYTQEILEVKRPQEPSYEDFKPNQNVFSKNGKLELEHA
ncbi:hypothetical protein [Flavobacterium chilense]|uniref:Uncharacterized protein n=1 Tax=Flavobacterium chilense TaxID=946677 RepID=A0A1M7DUF3_9FLAO|nr:hypothetical protein [Flavobacterium chilense]SHL83067.1 hypothetical protein SAMN05444484_102728 [Flavobacterium chilense]